MSTEITKAEPTSGQALYRVSTDAAGLCREIVMKTACKIGGRKYVKCEGWQAIAIAHGCVASASDVRRLEDGYAATGTIRRMSDGAVIATAEGFLGDDEQVWAKRPTYAKRAMCQTRSISRACRSAFAHVVVLIDGGLSTTPAEEVPEGGFQDDHQGKTIDAPPAKPATAAVQADDIEVCRSKTAEFCKAGGLPVTGDEIAACTTVDQLRALCRRKKPEAAPMLVTDFTDKPRFAGSSIGSQNGGN
jgi:hypothetical protein